MNNRINKKQIEEKVEETLLSIEGMQRATPAPYLLTRINARKQEIATRENSIWFRLGIMLSRPVVAVSCLLLLLLLNTVVINIAANYTGMAGKNIATQQRDEFAMNVLSIYETETNEP
ncbi:MAG: hypothetical protein ABIW38_03260 [Ferruginibacter sp.]